MADTNKKTEDWAEMSDDAEEEIVEKEVIAEEKAAVVQEEKKEEEPKKIIPPTQKGTKNVRGDYVVTTIDIKDTRTGIVRHDDGQIVNDVTDSDTEYDDEDDVKETNAEAAVEESK